MRFGSWFVAAALVTSLGACKKDTKDETKAPGKTTTKEPTKEGSGSASAGSGSASAGSGSASAGAGSASAGSGSGTAAPAGEMTADEMAAQYATCWGYFNDNKLDQFKACFAPDVKSQDVDEDKPNDLDHIAKTAEAIRTAFPDGKAEVEMTFVSPPHVVGIVLFTGTQSGPLSTKGGQSLPASNKKVGFLMGHVIDFDPKTKLAVGEYTFMDPMQMMGQLGIMNFPHREPMTASLPEKGTVVTEQGTDVEKANLEALKAAVDAFNKHDAAAFAATRTDDMTFYDSSTPTDVNKDAMMQGVQVLWQEFSNLQNQVGGAFAAGEYVVSYGAMVGTNDGDLVVAKAKATGKAVKLGYLAIGHYKDGKIDKAWRFVNGLSMPMQLGLLK